MDADIDADSVDSTPSDASAATSDGDITLQEGDPDREDFGDDPFGDTDSSSSGGDSSGDED